MKSIFQVKPSLKKELLNKIVAQRINAGVIQDRNDVVQTLAEYGIITRNAKDTISVKLHGDKTAIKMEGSFIKMDSMSLLTQKIELEQKQIKAHQEQMKSMQNELMNSITNFNEQLNQELDSLQTNTRQRLQIIDSEILQHSQVLISKTQDQTESVQKLTHSSAELLNQVQILVKQAESLNIQSLEQQQTQQQQQKISLILSVSCTALLLILIIISLVK
ncbi:hypothetical protein MOV98_17105 (plasmid) [Acinetobacter variabilis]|nr:hypothetical protein MOV98_17105 [Acinetobacter variabilis]